ncbi:MAG: hypothetical protein ACLQBB_08205 [Solirubrobacteraceae bacterium]
MTVYHVELRKFPRTVNRFNASGPEVGAIVIPWVQERVFELDDQKWAPWESSITIIEGPEIPLNELSIGRGWRTAMREGEDVTERILTEATEALAAGSTGSGAAASAASPAPAASSDGDQLAVGVELAGLLGADAMRLLQAWRLVAARSSGLAPSESLALAERELASGEGDAA